MGRSAFPHEEPLVLTPQESELSKKRKKCESLEQEARKKQRRCEELVSSQGPPQVQPGGGLPLPFHPSCPSGLSCPAWRRLQVVEEGLVWEGQVLCVGRGGVWVLGSLPRAPLVSQELQLREAQNENARLVEENSRLSGRATEKEQVAALPMCCGAWTSAGALVPGLGAVFSTPCTGRAYEGYCFPGEGAAQTRLTHLAPCPPPQVEWENAELRGQLLGVTQERDSALRKSQGLQSKLEGLEQVLKVRRLWTWGEGLGPWHRGGWEGRMRPMWGAGVCGLVLALPTPALLWPRFPF